MAHLLGLEWDGREARVAVARRRGSELVLEHAFTVDLGREGASEAEIGKRIQAALAARQVGRCDTLVAVGRSRIELRSLTLPPSPVEELPDMVRFQALRQFAAIGDDWPIDFVHLATGEEESLTVLAAAISPEMVEQILATCTAASQTPKRLVLRSFAAASLLRRKRRDNGCRLLIDMLAEEADLTVIADRQLVFMRTVRLPEGDDPQKRSISLMGEIRRTMVAAQNQLGGRRVDEIVLCGGEQEHAALQARLTESLELPISLFDPLDEVHLGGELAAGLPPNPGRFAPLLGMLLDECSGAAHAIDFLHPRQRPKPQSKRRLLAIAGAGLAAVVLLAAGGVYYQFSSMKAEIESKQQTLDGLKEAEKAAQVVISRVDTLNEWSQGDVVWLDELRYLSANFPPPEKVIVGQLRSAADGRDKIAGHSTLDCASVDSQTVTDVERRLTDRRHSVYGAGSQPRDAEYGRAFTKTVTVTPSEPEPATGASAESASDQDAPAVGPTAAASPANPSTGGQS